MPKLLTPLEASLLDPLREFEPVPWWFALWYWLFPQPHPDDVAFSPKS